MHHGSEIDLRDFVMGYTTPQNLAGLPTCCIRAGFTSDGLPIGLQLSGPPWSDERVLFVAEEFFGATPEIQERRPDTAERATIT